MVLLPAGATISELDGPSDKIELPNMLPTKLFQTMHAHPLEQLVGNLLGTSYFGNFPRTRRVGAEINSGGLRHICWGCFLIHDDAPV